MSVAHIEHFLSQVYLGWWHALRKRQRQALPPKPILEAFPGASASHFLIRLIHSRICFAIFSALGGS